MMKLNIKSVIGIAAIMLAVGMGAGWLFFGETETISADHNHEAGDPATWTCSMHPQVRQNEFGACPICGMDLIELTTDLDSDPLAISMSENAMKLANIETMKVSKTETSKQIRLTGKVQADERRVFSQSSHIPGRVEKLSINFTGEYVRKGSPIAFIYSPDLVTAQEELFEAYRIKDTQPALFEASKNKLRNWKISDAQIDEIINSGKTQQEFPILSDRSGFVTKMMVKLGDYLMAGTKIYEVADLSKVWVQFDVYEADLAWLKKGSEIDFSIASIPGLSFRGNVSYIDPVINPKTRVAQARIEVSNQDGKLKPEMFATGNLSSTGVETIILPKSAVMWTGERSVVYVKKTNDNGISFVMREVIIGPDFGNTYEIVNGIMAGDEVAVSGTFSIDAAAQLAGKPSMMNPDGGEQSLGGHAGMDMGNAKTTPDEQTKKVTSFNDIDPQFKLQFTDVVSSYLELKDAFVSTDSSKAGSITKTFNKALAKVNMGLLEGDAHLKWMEMIKPINKAVGIISNDSDIATQRLAFADLSVAIFESIKIFNVTGLNINYQFCPMARDGQGANWLSLDTEIRNPYYGESMLTCGETIETIK